MGRREARGGLAVFNSPNTPSSLGPYDLGLERPVGRVRSTTCQGPLGQADRAIRVRVGSSMGAAKARVRQGREGGLTQRDAAGRARGRKGPERGWGAQHSVCLGRPTGSGAGWLSSPAGPARRAERPRGARRAAFVRLVADGGRLGWRPPQPGHRNTRRAPAALVSLPLAPPTSPSPCLSSHCFLFLISTAL